MLIADNMVKCNAYWMAKAAEWKQRGVKPCDVRARIANRLTRTVFTMISGRQVYHHPSRIDRGYIIDKLLTFYREHKTEPAVIVRDLKHAADMIPTAARKDEAPDERGHPLYKQSDSNYKPAQKEQNDEV